MTKDQMIANILSERQAVFERLHSLTAGGGPDREKEALADSFNELTAKLRELGYHA